jgi:cellulose synthase (UDP-forming)
LPHGVRFNAFEGTPMHKARSILIWAVVSLCVIVLITLPVSLQTQLIASITVVAFMAVIKG